MMYFDITNNLTHKAYVGVPGSIWFESTTRKLSGRRTHGLIRFFKGIIHIFTRFI